MLDILMKARRNQEAAEAFLRRLVDGHGYLTCFAWSISIAPIPS